MTFYLGPYYSRLLKAYFYFFFIFSRFLKQIQDRKGRCRRKPLARRFDLPGTSWELGGPWTPTCEDARKGKEELRLVDAFIDFFPTPPGKDHQYFLERLQTTN